MNQSKIENVQPEQMMNEVQKADIISSAQVSPMQCYAHFQSKVCTKCNKEKSIDNFFKRGDSPHLYRSHCKECLKPQSNKSGKIYFQRHKAEIRDKRKARYQTDLNFRKKELARMSKKYADNRDLNCQCCGEILPKYSIKFCDGCRKKAYSDYIKEWNIKMGKDYINALQNKRVKKKSNEVTDGYVAGQIRGNKFPGWKIEEMPKPLIELKRNSIKLKRELKKQNKKS